IRANHSSLHLLHSALKVVVGNHVNQAGSYVSDEYARFDFTHFEKVTADQLKAIENFVNMSIFSNAEVVTEMMSMDDAKNSGAIALFDEKYGDEVRVVTMGNVSKELCGGTHVHNTSEVGVFKIDFEESIGSGIRRIQVKTGLAAYHEFIKYLNTIESLASSLELKGISMVEEKVITLIEEHKEVKKELAQFKEKAILMQADQLVNDATTKEGIKYLLVEVENTDGKKLKGLAETIKNKAKEVFIVALSKDSEGYTLVVCASKKANEQGLKAGAIVKEALTLVNGKGGGRDDLAQGGSKDLSTYEQIKTHLTKLF
ncbi:MAG: DHHA1 domain-containing protein, partial [Erysipelotrichaceae bacterium]